MNTPPDAALDEHAGHVMGAAPMAGPLAPLNRAVAVVTPLHLAPPVLISPPSKAARVWTARSDSANRPLRTNLELDATGAIRSRVDFAQRPLVDRLVGVGVAAHEGQLFGWLNQALGVFTALGLWTVSVSALVLWWQRRPALRLGAPEPRVNASRVPALIVAVAVMLALVFPMMGVTLLLVLGLERAVLVRIPATRRFLGLGQAA